MLGPKLFQMIFDEFPVCYMVAKSPCWLRLNQITTDKAKPCLYMATMHRTVNMTRMVLILQSNVPMIYVHSNEKGCRYKCVCYRLMLLFWLLGFYNRELFDQTCLLVRFLVCQYWSPCTCIYVTSNKVNRKTLKISKTLFISSYWQCVSYI